MAKGFTDIAIRNLKAGDVRRELPDAGCAGLYVIVQPSGKKSFAVRYRFNGQPKKLTLPGGLTLKAARKLASDAMLDLEKGIDPAASKKTAKEKAATAKAQTVQWCCEKYLAAKDGGLKLRTIGERNRTLERLVYGVIGNTPLAALKRSHIVHMLDDIQKQNGDRTADLTLAYLRKAFNWYAARVDDFNSPIVRNMSRYDAKANQGTRTLTDDELRTIWKATEPTDTAQPVFALIRFLLLTGARRAEATEMPWSEIDGATWVLPAARNKVKVELVRPLSKAAMAVLGSVPHIDGSKFVFSNNGKTPLSLTKALLRLIALTGVAGWTPHDLRRTCRTLMARAGVPDTAAEQCLGHTLPGAVAQIYNKHQYRKEMVQAYEALAAQIERIVNPVANVTPLRCRKKAAD